MALAVLAGISVFILVLSVGMLMFHQAPTEAQIASSLVAVETLRDHRRSAYKVSEYLGNLAGKFNNVLPHNANEMSRAQKRLVQAGFRSESAVRVFFGIQFLSVLGLPILSIVTGLAQRNLLVVLLVSAALGYILPDFVLSNVIKRRLKAINLALPNVLDMMIVCMEAGLSLDRATMRTADEMEEGSSAIADELNVVMLEQRAGCPRSDAWKHLAERTESPRVRNVVSMLVQAEQFGTSVAKTLRVYSETMRTQRKQDAEEVAAKMGVKMLLPIVGLIFPAIFVVAIGPAFITMMESFKK